MQEVATGETCLLVAKSSNDEDHWESKSFLLVPFMKNH